MANTKYYGTGRRKSSVARVYLVPGTGKITVNKRDIDEYFGLETLKVIVRQPLTVTETADKFDVLVNVKGGGYTGHAGAQTISKWFKKPGKSRFSGLLLYLNGLIWFDQIWQNESRFPPIFSGPQVVNWLKRGQKEGKVVPKVVNREPIFGVLFSPPSPRFLAVAVWHSLT